MAPNLSEDEIDELLYLVRIGDRDDFIALTKELGNRERCTIANLLETAKDGASGNGVLHMAAANGHDGRFRSPLISNTLTNKHSEILNLVLDNLSKPLPQNPTMLAILNTQNLSGNTALHWAALNGNLESVKKLLEYGADPTITNQKGHDAIYEAELNYKTEVVEWVLKEGGEGLETGLENELAGGEGAAGVSLDEDEPMDHEDKSELEATMDKMDIKEDSAHVNT